MIKNIVFDIGNVIFNFNYKRVLRDYTLDKDKQNFIEKYIINSPEWLEYSLLDFGYMTKEQAISIVQDRTNHIYDDLIDDFWRNCNNYGYVDDRVLELITKLRKMGYKVYLLSNISSYTVNNIKKSGIFSLVDGFVLSYLEHQVKPYCSIYNTLIKRYNIKPNETVFIDDNARNIDTANELGIIGLKVEPDNYDSVIYVLRKLNII